MIHCYFLKQSASLLYFYKTADQFVCSCLKQKQINKKKHQQTSLLNFCFLFSPNAKKNFVFCLAWSEKKKNTESQKQRFWAKGEEKKEKTSKAFLFGQEKKVFFLSRVLFFCFLWDIFFEAKTRLPKKKEPSVGVAENVVKKKRKPQQKKEKQKHLIKQS